MSSELVLSNYTWDHFSTERPNIPPKLEGGLRLFVCAQPQKEPDICDKTAATCKLGFRVF